MNQQVYIALAVLHSYHVSCISTPMQLLDLSLRFIECITEPLLTIYHKAAVSSRNYDGYDKNLNKVFFLSYLSLISGYTTRWYPMLFPPSVSMNLCFPVFFSVLVAIRFRLRFSLRLKYLHPFARPSLPDLGLVQVSTDLWSQWFTWQSSTIPLEPRTPVILSLDGICLLCCVIA